MRTHNGLIQKLPENGVFVFGSNLAGRHGAGAALLAKQRFGAVPNKGIGLFGRSYALPTKDKNVAKTLSLGSIQQHVNTFLDAVRDNPDKLFYLTEIGCGLAGLTAKEVAPMFLKGKDFSNIIWPKKFVTVLEKTNAILD